jgi:multidrug resistance protein
MADPEIELTKHSLPLSESSDAEKERVMYLYDETSTRHNSGSTGKEKEILPNSTSYHENISPTSGDILPLEHLYLAFDTELPIPAIDALSQQSRNNLPLPPDLSHFANPFEWPSSRKSFILWISCIATCFTAFSAGAYSPGSKQMEREWDVSHVAILVGITTFTMGFAIAPMVLAPFSELNGRKPVFIVTGFLFAFSQLCCGITRSYGGLLVARFFVGVGGSTFSTMVGGVVSDIYQSSDRNAPMALFSGAALFGTGLGPLICGFIAQNIYFRWMFYVQAIVDGTLILILAIFFKETRGSVILSRKATALNKWYSALEDAGCPGVWMHDAHANSVRRIRWKVAADEQRASIAKMISVSLSRPFHLLLTEPILFSFSLWVSFSWAVLYLTLAAIPLVFNSVYQFNVQAFGAVFASLSIGALIFTPIAIFQERLASKHPMYRFLESPKAPEHRLLFACFESLLLPIGLFIFGWTARPHISPAIPALGLAIATMGIFSIYLATFNYLADVYGQYASSALAAQSFCRNVAGGVLPLVTGAMFHHLGIGKASSVLGSIGLGLGTVPWILLIFGAKVRSWSPFAVSGEGLR